MSSIRQSHADRAIDVIENSWRRFLDLVNHLQQLLQVRQKWEAAKSYAKEHPILTLFLLVTVGMCSVPITCFVAFACGSMFLTFMVFMFLEGFLLTVASLFLGGALFVVGCISLGLSSVLATAWYSVHTGHKLLNKVKSRVQQQPHQHQQLPMDSKDIGMEKEE